MTEQLRAELAAYLEENYMPPEEAGVWPSFSVGNAVAEPPVLSDELMDDSVAPSTDEPKQRKRRPRQPFFSKEKQELTAAQSQDLGELMEELGESFHEKLFKLIDASGMTDVDVYKRAGMDRKLFSKIRSNPAYHPRKATVLALAIALKLDIKEADDLLSRAEYAFSPGSKADLIVKFFIEHQVYDIDAVNYALDEYGLPILS